MLTRDTDYLFTTTFDAVTFDGHGVDITLVDGTAAVGPDMSSARAEGPGFSLRLASARAGSNFRRVVALADLSEIHALRTNIFNLPGRAGGTDLLVA